MRIVKLLSLSRPPVPTGGVQDGGALAPMIPRDVERLDDELRDLD